MTKRAVVAVALLLIVSALFVGVNFSMEVSGAPSRRLPSQPQNFSAESMNNQIKLRWDHPLDSGDTPRIGYVLLRGPNSDSLVVLKSDFGPFITQYTDKAVTNGRYYYYGIKAINEEGVGDISDLIVVKPVGPAGPPKNFTVEYGPNIVHLEWETPESDGGDDIIGYRIMKGPTKTMLDTIIDIPILTNYSDIDVVNGVSYYYTVRASNSYQVNGSMPDSLQVTPRGTPGAPGDFNVTGLDRQVHLNWTYPPDDGGGSIIRYDIHRGFSEDSIELYFSPIGLNTEYLDENITNGHVYYYAVSAINMEGNGDLSEIVNIIPVGVPDSPINLSIKPGDTEATLTWKTPEDDGGSEIQGYNVYRTTKGVEMKFITDVGLDQVYTDTNLTNGDTYYYQVRAYNALGIGFPSKNEEVRPDFLPATPGNFRTKEFEGYIKLLWAHPPLNLDYPITEFRIFKGTSEDDLQLLVALNSTMASYEDIDVEVGVEYFYIIKSYSDIGEGKPSELITGIPFSAPTIIGNLEADPGDGIVVITWTEPTFSGGRDIVNYKIYRGENRESLAVKEIVQGSQLIYNDTDVENGVTYFYAVMPVNEKMDGKISAPVEANPIGPPTPPRNLVTSVDGDAIVLEWDQPRSNGGRTVTGFIILRGPSKFNLSEYDQIGLVQNYTDANVEKGDQYFYAVVAVNSVGDSKRSTPSGTEIYVPPVAENEGENYTPLMIGVIAVVLLIIAMVIFVIIMSKRKDKQAVEGAQDFEESDKEKEHRLVLERRKQMKEFTDVSLSTAEAHEHDHDEHGSTYEDIYGNTPKAEEEVQSDEVAPPEQAEPQPAPPDYQPPEETVPPPPQPAPPEEPATAEQPQGELQAEYMPPQRES